MFWLVCRNGSYYEGTKLIIKFDIMRPMCKGGDVYNIKQICDKYSTKY